MRQRFTSVFSGYSLRHTVREQVEALLASVDRLIVSNTIVAIFTSSIFFGTANSGIAQKWLYGVICSLIATSAIARRIRKQGWADNDAPAIARKLVIMAGVRGFFWFLGMAVLMSLANAGQSYMLGFVAFGMMVGGVFAYWSLPLAALTFSCLVWAGAMLGLELGNFEWRMSLFVVLSVSLVFFNRVALAHSAALRKHVETEGHLRAEQEVVGLLLRDYEDNSKDWLWQTDSAGLMTRGQVGFCAAIPGITSELATQPLCDALAPHSTTHESAKGLSSLRSALESSAAFSDVEIIIGTGPEAVHLMLSAKPRLSPAGEHLGWHGVASNISAERKAEARVQRLAHFDGLTGLPNRAQLRTRLEELRSKPGNVPCWLLYGDLDGFKHVNDTLGHAAGDAVLCELANRFTSTLQQNEMVARIGGDEFVFILQRTPDALESLWQALIATAAESVPLQGQSLVVGMSLGIVELDDETISVDELLRRADLALYNAKQQGKGTARHFVRSMDVIARQRRAMERELRAAVAAKQFEVHYQPIYSCLSGELQSYEALVRWKHPSLGPIAPSTFIPLAEDCGLITELGGWVLRRACEDAKSFPGGVGISVNISAIQLKSRRLLADVTQALAESGLAPARLELEMTESALMDNIDFAKSMIDNLKALGVGVALDDFGTGYSSLAYLHRFRFDRIKIDRSFVQAYGERNESKAVVDAVVMIARQLGISITAEGIETVEQYQAMVDRGCDLAQGYLLGRPAPLGRLKAASRDRSAM